MEPSSRPVLALLGGWLALALGAGLSGRVAALQPPASMAALLRLPLSLLPTFLVPLIIASHVQLFRRLRTANVTE